MFYFIIIKNCGSIKIKKNDKIISCKNKKNIKDNFMRKIKNIW